MSTPNNNYIPLQHPNVAGFQFPPPYIPGQHPNMAGFQFPPPYVPSQHPNMASFQFHVPPPSASGQQYYPLV